MRSSMPAGAIQLRPTRVGDDIIDRIGELDAKALHVLAVVFGILIRTSRK
jgi:hypothetical protein